MFSQSLVDHMKNPQTLTKRTKHLILKRNDVKKNTCTLQGQLLLSWRGWIVFHPESSLLESTLALSLPPRLTDLYALTFWPTACLSSLIRTRTNMLRLFSVVIRACLVGQGWQLACSHNIPPSLCSLEVGFRSVNKKKAWPRALFTKQPGSGANKSLACVLCNFCCFGLWKLSLWN